MCDEEQHFTQIESNQTKFQLSLLDLPIEVCINKFLLNFYIRIYF